MTEKETKKDLVIAFSAYSTHSDVSLDKWLEVQDKKRSNQTFKKRYIALIGKK